MYAVISSKRMRLSLQFQLHNNKNWISNVPDILENLEIKTKHWRLHFIVLGKTLLEFIAAACLVHLT